jgi:hypothetical protein
VVPPIIVEPKPEKACGEEEAEDDDAIHQIEHRENTGGDGARPASLG